MSLLETLWRMRALRGFAVLFVLWVAYRVAVYYSDPSAEMNQSRGIAAHAIAAPGIVDVSLANQSPTPLAYRLSAAAIYQQVVAGQASGYATALPSPHAIASYAAAVPWWLPAPSQATHTASRASPSARSPAAPAPRYIIIEPAPIRSVYSAIDAVDMAYARYSGYLDIPRRWSPLASRTLAPQLIAPYPLAPHPIAKQSTKQPSFPYRYYGAAQDRYPRVVTPQSSAYPTYPTYPTARASSAPHASTQTPTRASVVTVDNPTIGSAPPQAGWAGSVWAYWRAKSANTAPGGHGSLLGGSQLGGRISRSLAGQDRLRAFLRASYAPNDFRPLGEIAFGFAYRPLTKLPIDINVERRQDLSAGYPTYSGYGLYATGGISDAKLPLGLRMEGYGQGGVIFARETLGFAEGALYVGGKLYNSPAFGSIEFGGLAGGSIQAGAARVDVGPRLLFHMPEVGKGARISLDWRQRVVGDAEPNSGLAATFAADF